MKLKPGSKNRIICLEGVDGCGKSTQIQHIVRKFDASFCWLRWKPVLLKPLYAVVHYVNKDSEKSSADMKIQTYQKNESLKGKIFKREWICKIWYTIAFIDYYISTKMKIRTKKNHTIMVFDRYFYDFIIDQGINLGWSPQKIMDEIKSMSKFFKSPDLTIYLNLQPDLAFKRKNDIPDKKYLTARYQLYQKIAQELGWVQIDATKPIEKISQTIEKIIEGEVTNGKTRCDFSGWF